MILIHSAFNPTATNTSNPQLQNNSINERIAKYIGYQAACEKYSAEIKVIQKFFPGWLPSLPSK